MRAAVAFCLMLCSCCVADEYFLHVFVNAHGFDYSCPERYFEGLSQYKDTGHAWIALEVCRTDGRHWRCECGHTGEFGLRAPRYFDHLRALSAQGEENPARYLFTILSDGQLEFGSGEHKPTLAVRFPLMERQFYRILRLFNPDGYDFFSWALKGPNCVEFVRTCLACADIYVDCFEPLVLPSSFFWGDEQIFLWKESSYAALTVSTPERLEKALVELIEQGRGDRFLCPS